MPHTIIKGSEATARIKNFLEDKEDRTTKIGLLNLQEVNVYIKTVKAMQKECKQITH